MDQDRISQLEADVVYLMKEVDRYRTATNDILEQLDWCIGYLTATRKGRVARSLSVNRDHIRTTLLGRAPESLPTTEAEAG